MIMCSDQCVAALQQLFGRGGEAGMGLWLHCRDGRWGHAGMGVRLHCRDGDMRGWDMAALQGWYGAAALHASALHASALQGWAQFFMFSRSTSAFFAISQEELANLSKHNFQAGSKASNRVATSCTCMLVSQ